MLPAVLVSPHTSVLTINNYLYALWSRYSWTIGHRLEQSPYNIQPASISCSFDTVRAVSKQHTLRSIFWSSDIVELFTIIYTQAQDTYICNDRQLPPLFCFCGIWVFHLQTISLYWLLYLWGRRWYLMKRKLDKLGKTERTDTEISILVVIILPRIVDIFPSNLDFVPHFLFRFIPPELHQHKNWNSLLKMHIRPYSHSAQLLAQTNHGVLWARSQFLVIITCHPETLCRGPFTRPITFFKRQSLHHVPVVRDLSASSWIRIPLRVSSCLRAKRSFCWQHLQMVTKKLKLKQNPNDTIWEITQRTGRKDQVETDSRYWMFHPL